MMVNLVTFKGNKEGIYIYLKEGSLEAIKEELKLKLENSKTFFKGAKVINFRGRKLSTEEKEELKSIITNKYGIEVEENNIEAKEYLQSITTDDNKSYYKNIDEGSTKFIRATIRSGQCIEYDGNIAVIGDVNPGGVIIAKGNIIVLGSLRGVAIAGSDGNKSAIVCAFDLQPTQLRIANVIARSPDNEIIESRYPEVASIKDNMVVIEPL